MRSDFNLIRDPWIPVGKTTVSIRDALVKAHELPGWPGGDFGVAETVIRLLVPMAYRITGLDDDEVGNDDDLFAEQQAALLNQGQFDEASVKDYFTEHFDRFWLLGGPDKCVPFAQDPTLRGVDPHEAAKAVTGWASGNNPVLGPHADTRKLTPDLAAQRLLVLRAYAWGGLHTKHPDWTGLGKFVGGALRGTMSVHPVGNTLAETLIGHLVPLPGGDTGFGRPFWELPVPENPVTSYRNRAGLLEQIVGRQDKTMLLRTEASDITGFTIAEGPGLDRSLFCEDPYLLLDPKFEPLKPKAGRAFWRESEALLTQSGASTNRRDAQAHILEWASGENSDLYNERKFSWAIISHRGDKSKDLEWSRSTAPTLLRIFDPEAARRALGFLHLVKEAESLMAKQIAKVWHATGQMPAKAADKAAVYRPARVEFWKRCEQDFWRAVDGQSDTQQTTDQIRSHALAGFDRVTDLAVRNQRALPTVVESRKWLERWERPRRAAPQDHQPDEEETTT